MLSINKRLINQFSDHQLGCYVQKHIVLFWIFGEIFMFRMFWRGKKKESSICDNNNLICRCDIVDILLEMDRILRPEGAVIIRDHVDVVVKTKRVAEQLRWQSRIVHSEKGPFHPEKLLIVDNSIAASAN